MIKLGEICRQCGIWPFFTGESPFQLPLYLVGWGHEKRSSATYRWDGMKRGNHPLFIWQYTLRGHGWLRIGPEELGNVKRIEPGMAMCLVVPGKHCYYYQEDVPGEEWEFVFVDIAGTESVRLGQQLIDMYGMAVQLRPEGATLSRFIQISKSSLDGRAMSRYENCTVATDFFMSLFQECSNSPRTPTDIIRLCQEYCQEHLQEKLSLDRLARFAGYSRYHFSRLFLDATGENLPGFLERLRLNQAILMLQGTGRNSIKEIAVNCGFGSSSYFCRIFREHYGVSPQQWRSNNAEQRLNRKSPVRNIY